MTFFSPLQFSFFLLLGTLFSTGQLCAKNTEKKMSEACRLCHEWRQHHGSPFDMHGLSKTLHSNGADACHQCAQEKNDRRPS